jgi:hypothetical protein
MMGIFSNFFKSGALPEDEIAESENVMRKLREKRQENTSEWVASIQDPGSLLPPSYTRIKIPPKPTIEDVDQREAEDTFVYSPPVEAMYTPFEDEDTQGGLAQAKNATSADWVSKMFGEFEHQGNSFNASAQGTNLVISIHPPQYTEEVVPSGEYGKETKVRFFKGYVSTTFWGMLLHGHHDKIDVYIVPAEAILELTLSDISQSGFSPYLTIDSQIKNGALEWHVGGDTIVYAAIPNLAKELVGDLIKVASGKLANDQLFAEHAGGLKLDQGAAQNLSQVMRIIKEDDAAPAPAAVATAVKAAAPPADPLLSLNTFNAGALLTDAIAQDLAVISRLSEPGSGLDQTKINQLRELTSAMRTLHGQVSTFNAQYKPKNK